MKTADRLLLDTCAMIYLAHDEPIAAGIKEEIVRVRKAKGVIAVSAISAWEIGLLVARGRLPTKKSAMVWFDDFVRLGRVGVEAAAPEILIASSFLPQPIHNDPADRIVIATARENDMTIVTRDRTILSYGAAGFVSVLAC